MPARWVSNKPPWLHAATRHGPGILRDPPWQKTCGFCLPHSWQRNIFEVYFNPLGWRRHKVVKRLPLRPRWLFNALQKKLKFAKRKKDISWANVPRKPLLKLRVSHCSVYGRHCINTGWYLGQTHRVNPCEFAKDFQWNSLPEASLVVSSLYRVHGGLISNGSSTIYMYILN